MNNILIELILICVQYSILLYLRDIHNLFMILKTF